MSCSHPWRFRVRNLFKPGYPAVSSGHTHVLRILFCQIFTVCLLLTTTVTAQPDPDLNRLVFEEVLLTEDLSQWTSPAALATVSADADSESDASNRATLQQDISRYKASIEALAQTQATWSEELREQYLSLALLYQKTGDHEAAISVLESAMHIDRVNQGLFTITQIELVNLLLESHAALGQYDEVANFQEYLFYIQNKSFAKDDPRLLAARENWADWNVSSYFDSGSFSTTGSGLNFSNNSDYVAIQDTLTGKVVFVQRQNMQNVLSPNSRGIISANSLTNNAFTVTAEELVDKRLLVAEEIYEALLEQVPETTDPARQLLLQQKIASVTFANKQFLQEMTRSSQLVSPGINTTLNSNTNIPLVNRGYNRSRDALEELATSLTADPQTSPESIVQTYLSLGDWHMAFNRPSRAREAYALAWQHAQVIPGQTDNAMVNPVLNPRIIQPVPAFAMHPFSRARASIPDSEVLAYKGYIDVSLDLDRNGRVKRSNILATSGDTSQTLRSALLNYLRENRMRPILKNGETVTTENIALRFYYYY